MLLAAVNSIILPFTFTIDAGDTLSSQAQRQIIKDKIVLVESYLSELGNEILMLPDRKRRKAIDLARRYSAYNKAVQSMRTTIIEKSYTMSKWEAKELIERLERLERYVLKALVTISS